MHISVFILYFVSEISYNIAMMTVRFTRHEADTRSGDVGDYFASLLYNRWESI